MIEDDLMVIFVIKVNHLRKMFLFAEILLYCNMRSERLNSFNLEFL
jgi:hypothetical protein